MILQLKDGVVTPVFVSSKKAYAYTIYQAGGSINWDSTLGTITFPSSHDVSELEVGMTLQGMSSVQQMSYINMIITYINTTTNTITISGDLTWLDLNTGPQAAHGTSLFFYSIGFTSEGSVLGFHSDHPITGINIIDDMLFWTDNNSEPKKINISRSIQGTAGITPTRLVVNGEVFDDLVEESHITVIKKAPNKAPTVKKVTSFREGEIYSTLVAGADIFGNSQSNVPLPVGSQKWISINDFEGNIVSFEIGDVLRFSSNPQELAPEYFEIRASIIQGPSVQAGFTNYKIEIESMSQMGLITSINSTITNWNVGLEQEGKTLFEQKLPRFSTRYKYEDNEYSTMGPFTEPVFIPGGFRYHPKEAYNTGMVNSLRELTLQDFIPTDIPKDVVQVDLLYKNEMSPNIYTIESITKDDTKINGENAWTSQGSQVGLFGSYKVSSENIYATLPSNQLLRPWDNVPRTALAQEVSGNRIIYGNYLQNYDLTLGDEKLVPHFITTIGHRKEDEGNRGKKSIKSLRDYDLGVVWGDKYGRETPIITPSSGSISVPKGKSARS